jgi:hypothetical protein
MIILAFIVAGFKFPFIGRGPNLSGISADTWPRLREPGKWLHDLTNLAVEAVRADAQWFAKFFSFALGVSAVANGFMLWALIG